MARPLNALALGDETATSLGLRAGRTRLLGAAGATAAVRRGRRRRRAHRVRRPGRAAHGPGVTGSDHRWLLPYCLVLGPVLLLAADILGRVLARPGELPVGAVTAFVGAPFLILAVRRGRVGL